MKINGAKIFNEGVFVDSDCKEKIREIVDAVNGISESPEISIRFLKRGKTYEALLWGRANSIPIGVYRQGPSLPYVLVV